MCFERLHSPAVITVVVAGIIWFPIPRYIPGIRFLRVILPYPTPTLPQLLQGRWNEMSVLYSQRCHTNSENLHVLIPTSSTHNHTPLYMYVQFLSVARDTSRVTSVPLCKHFSRLDIGFELNNFSITKQHKPRKVHSRTL